MSRGGRAFSSPRSSRCSSNRKAPTSRWRSCKGSLTAIPEFARRRERWSRPASIPGGPKPTQLGSHSFNRRSKGPPEGREAVLQAIGRNSRLAASPEILGTIRKLIARPEAAPSLLPVLQWPALADALVLSLLEQAWPRMTQPQRLDAIEVLLGPPCSAGSVGAFGICAQRAAPGRDGFVAGRARADTARHQQPAVTLVGASRDDAACSRRLPTTRPPCAGRA